MIWNNIFYYKLHMGFLAQIVLHSGTYTILYNYLSISNLLVIWYSKQAAPINI